MSEKEQQPQRLTLIQVLFSSLAALFGVQNESTRHRDFTRGTPGQFIAVGIILAVVLVVAIVVLVKVVMSVAIN